MKFEVMFNNQLKGFYKNLDDHIRRSLEELSIITTGHVLKFLSLKTALSLRNMFFQFFDYIGIWTKNDVYKDIIKFTLQSVKENKEKIINECLEKFKEHNEIFFKYVSELKKIKDEDLQILQNKIGHVSINFEFTTENVIEISKLANLSQFSFESNIRKFLDDVFNKKIKFY